MASIFKTPDSPLVKAIHPSPNIGERLNALQPSILLMHYTGMSTATKAIHWLAHPKSGVSCHYVIDEAGLITQMVAENARAWHAGQSFWSGETDINSASIGLEIQNPGHEDGYNEYPAAQMAAILALSSDIITRHKIRPERVLAHSDIAPARKIDPGEKFDWEFLAKNGVGHWVPPVPPTQSHIGFSPDEQSPLISATQEQLARYGYGIDVTGHNDIATIKVVSAFQRHFRPQRVDGIIDSSTRETLEKLNAALPEPLVG